MMIPSNPHPLAPRESELRLNFSAKGNAAAYCVSGWSTPEAAETWSVGTGSRMALPSPGAARPHILVLHLRPHTEPQRLPQQRLRVIANGVPVGEFTLQSRTVRACIIPQAALAGHPRIDLVFETPDAARPSSGQDKRQLSVAMESLQLYPDLVQSDDAMLGADDEMPLNQLMLHFESLGQNCEFGLVQRRCQAEPLGLLRFASAPLPKLLAALDAGFIGMGSAESIRVELSVNGREFMVTDTAYDIVYHAWVDAGQMTPEALHQREVQRVPLLVRKLLEDLAAGAKIFVFKGMGAVADEVVFPLAASLRRYGPNVLLFVTLAGAEHSAGTVEVKAPGFLVGYLDRFAPGQDANDLLLDQWVSVCRSAYRLAASG